MAQNADRGKKHSFEIKNGEFVYDSKPVQIYAGEIHYARIPQKYWKHRLQMVKALGLNTICVYVFWNHHNTQPGVWDFKTGNRDIVKFIKMAEEEGLFVILRPGPYACAEWEFGGYPWWLQKNKDLVVRENNPAFLDSCKQYINQLVGQVGPLQVTNGGPLIMVQVENEFGSYVSQRKDIPLSEHRKYNETIKNLLREAGFDVPLFTSDGSWLFEGGTLPGVLPTANGENNIENLKKTVNQYNGNQGPYMVAEFYPGWLDHWMEPFVRVPEEKIVAQLEKYLQNGVHFNFYMVHGGTNFGFTSGANYNNKFDIQPDLTSYDYDAPISEAGWATSKYMAIRDVMKKYVNYAIPEIPDRIPVISIASIPLKKSVSLWDMKEQIKPVISDKPLSFEDLNQGHGYVLYSRKFNQPIEGKLILKGLRDFATVYVNGERVGVLNRINNQYEMDIQIPFDATLDILVENMGRINYGAKITENTKGIISPVFINEFEIGGDWNMYSLPFDKQMDISRYPQKNIAGTPAVYSGEFPLDKVGDTFLDMSSWGKGIVYVNGHHLGRYWNAGPQQTLYLPGCWLKKGKNEILIFEQLNDTGKNEISAVEKPVLDQLK
ncbi:MAG: beta-galactosidase [Tannerella sp.]|nr:beta-galactosidase [Tannerella sp.]